MIHPSLAHTKVPRSMLPQRRHPCIHPGIPPTTSTQSTTPCHSRSLRAPITCTRPLERAHAVNPLRIQNTLKSPPVHTDQRYKVLSQCVHRIPFPQRFPTAQVVGQACQLTRSLTVTSVIWLQTHGRTAFGPFGEGWIHKGVGSCSGQGLVA